MCKGNRLILVHGSGGPRAWHVLGFWSEPRGGGQKSKQACVGEKRERLAGPEGKEATLALLTTGSHGNCINPFLGAARS